MYRDTRTAFIMESPMPKARFATGAAFEALAELELQMREDGSLPRPNFPPTVRVESDGSILLQGSRSFFQSMVSPQEKKTDSIPEEQQESLVDVRAVPPEFDAFYIQYVSEDRMFRPRVAIFLQAFFEVFNVCVSFAVCSRQCRGPSM
jgi:hypothetical protein